MAGATFAVAFWCSVDEDVSRVAVPAHGLFDGVGEGGGAQAELGLRAGGVDDERFVEFVAHLVDLADRAVDESERAHLHAGVTFSRALVPAAW